MDKEKRKPKSPLRQFLDEYILARHDFYAELDTAPEILVEKLQDLEQYKHPWESRELVPQISRIGNGWKIIIKAQQRKRGYQTAKVEAVLLSDEGGMTIFKGRIITGGEFYLFSLLSLLIVTIIGFITPLLRPGQAENVVCSSFAIIFLVVLIGLWLMLIQDGKFLFQSVERAMFTAENEQL